MNGITYIVFGEEAISREKKSFESGFKHGRTWQTKDERVALLLSHGFEESVEVIDDEMAERIS